MLRLRRLLAPALRAHPSRRAGSRRETGLARRRRAGGSDASRADADGRWLLSRRRGLGAPTTSSTICSSTTALTSRSAGSPTALRASNPALSPDGRRVAFEVERQRLARPQLALDTHRRATAPMRVAHPRRQLRARLHAGVVARRQDHRVLVVARRRAARHLPHGRRDARAHAHHRRSRARSRAALLARRQVALLRQRPHRRLQPLRLRVRHQARLCQATNVVDGVFDPAISPDGKTVAFVGFVADGYDARDGRARSARPGARPAPPLLDRPDVPPPAEEPPRPTRWYNPFRTLYPFTWKPYAVPDGYGEIIGFILSGGDVVGRHALEPAARLRHRPRRRRAVLGQLQLHGLWPSLNIGRGARARAARRPHHRRQRHRLGRRHLVGRHQHRAADLSHIVASSDLFFSYDWSKTRNITAPPVIDPSGLIPEFPRPAPTRAVGATWVYQATRRYHFSISTE